MVEGQSCSGLLHVVGLEDRDARHSSRSSFCRPALLGVEARDAGVASALANATQRVGSSIGLAVLRTIAITATSSWLLVHATSGANVAGQLAGMVHGYTTVSWVSGGLMRLCAILAVVLIRVHTESSAG